MIDVLLKHRHGEIRGSLHEGTVTNPQGNVLIQNMTPAFEAWLRERKFLRDDPGYAELWEPLA